MTKSLVSSIQKTEQKIAINSIYLIELLKERRKLHVKCWEQGWAHSEVKGGQSWSSPRHHLGIISWTKYSWKKFRLFSNLCVSVHVCACMCVSVPLYLIVKNATADKALFRNHPIYVDFWTLDFGICSMAIKQLQCVKWYILRSIAF